MNFWEQNEVKKKTERGRRNAQLLANVDRLDRVDIEAISMYLIDAYFIDGKIRGNRPEPTDANQKQWIANMNESDSEAIEKLHAYRQSMELRSADSIPLTEYQQKWVDYILGVTNAMPELPEPRQTALQDVNNMAEVPF